MIVCVMHIKKKRKTLEGDEDFYQGAVSTTSGHALVFISLGILSNLRDTKELHADGTFQTVPGLFTQLFTIHVTAYGKVRQVWSFFFL